MNDDNVIDAEIVENLPAVVKRIDTERPLNAGNVPSSSRPIIKWSEEWWANASREVQANRCTAHSSRTGDRCKHPSLTGQRVCRSHGGNTRASKEKARRELDEKAHPMAVLLHKLATDESLSAEVRLKAVINSLDRSIGRAAQTVEIGPTPAYQEVFDGIVGGSRDLYRSQHGYDPRVANAEVDQDNGGPLQSAVTSSSDLDFDPEVADSDHDSWPSDQHRDTKDPKVDRQYPSTYHCQGEDAIREAARVRRALEARYPQKRLGR